MRGKNTYFVTGLKKFSCVTQILETNRDFKRKLEESVVALNQSLWGLGSFFFSRTSSSTTTTTRHELLSSKRSELRSRLETHIIHVLDNTASLLLPFVYSSLKSTDIETWQRLDILLDATLTNQVSSKASISQGSALFRIAASAFTEIPSLKMIRDASLGSKELHFHHAPIFGLVCGLLGMDAETSQRAYLFVTLRDVVAATRLNLLGPMGASVMQHHIAVVAETVLEKWKDRDAGEACQTSPLLDAVQGCHGYLFSRLFCP
ncbi:hypothetical protein Bca4012_008831 [Brassica carinata]